MNSWVIFSVNTNIIALLLICKEIVLHSKDYNWKRYSMQKHTAKFDV